MKSEQTQSADEDRMMWFKAATQLLNELHGGTVWSAVVSKMKNEL